MVIHLSRSFEMPLLLGAFSNALPMSFVDNQQQPRKARVSRIFTHFGSAEDPVITNNATGRPKKNPAASWVFLVTDNQSVENAITHQSVTAVAPGHCRILSLGPQGCTSANTDHL